MGRLLVTLGVGFKVMFLLSCRVIHLIVHTQSGGSNAC